MNSQVGQKILAMEYKLQVHEAELKSLDVQLEKTTAALAKIQRTLDRVLWTIIGFTLFYLVSQIGIIEVLRKLL